MVNRPSNEGALASSRLREASWMVWQTRQALSGSDRARL